MARPFGKRRPSQVKVENISLGAGGRVQTIRVGAVRGGMEKKNAFVIDPVTLLWTDGPPRRGKARLIGPIRPREKSSSVTATNDVFRFCAYDFDSKEGSVSVAGKSEKKRMTF